MEKGPSNNRIMIIIMIIIILLFENENFSTLIHSVRIQKDKCTHLQLVPSELEKKKRKMRWDRGKEENRKGLRHVGLNHLLNLSYTIDIHRA